MERILEPLTDGDWAREETSSRRAAPSDAQGIATVLEQAFAEHLAALSADASAAAALDADAVNAVLERGPGWVAIRDRRLVGALTAEPDGGTLRITALAVVPERRGTGLGDLLVARVLEWAPPAGFDRLQADVHEPLANRTEAALPAWIRNIRPARGRSPGHPVRHHSQDAWPGRDVE